VLSKVRIIFAKEIHSCQLYSYLTDNPSKFFIWLIVIVTDAADVKPEITGEETKSTKKPKRYKN